MKAKLLGTARKPIRCYGHKHEIQIGERVYGYRERALSYREMQHAGTWYPLRKVCEVHVPDGSVERCTQSG